jgi:hypothetical protein
MIPQYLGSLPHRTTTHPHVCSLRTFPNSHLCWAHSAQDTSLLKVTAEIPTTTGHHPFPSHASPAGHCPTVQSLCPKPATSTPSSQFQDTNLHMAPSSSNSKTASECSYTGPQPTDPSCAQKLLPHVHMRLLPNLAGHGSKPTHTHSRPCPALQVLPAQDAAPPHPCPCRSPPHLFSPVPTAWLRPLLGSFYVKAPSKAWLSPGHRKLPNPQPPCNGHCPIPPMAPHIRCCSTHMLPV